MNSEETNDTQSNPFEPPAGAPLVDIPQSLGFEFWMPIAVCFVLGGLFCVSYQTAFFGVTGIISTGFAMVRGILLQSRYRQAQVLGVPYAFDPGFIIFVKSILLGLVSTVASGIAFMVICVPLGIVAMSSQNAFAPILIISAIAGLLAGFGLIRMTVSKVPNS